MNGGVARHDPAADMDALRLLLRLCAAILGGAILAASRVLDGSQLLAIGGGLLFGLLAPGRWMMAVAGTLAASAMTLLIPVAEPWTAGLALPGAAVGFWLRLRSEPGDAVPWPDAVVAGISLELLVLSALVLGLLPAGFVGLAFSAFGGDVGFVFGALTYVALIGYTHVCIGRVGYNVVPGRFVAFAAGQGTVPVALALIEPGPAGALVVLGLIRLALVGAGYTRAQARARMKSSPSQAMPLVHRQVAAPRPAGAAAPAPTREPWVGPEVPRAARPLDRGSRLQPLGS